MSEKTVPIPQSPRPIPLDTAAISSSSSSSLWDRITTWASEHKAVVYTIAGVTLVVTAAGVVYYVQDSSKASKAPESAKTAKNRKKKEKKRAKEAEQAAKETTDGLLPVRHPSYDSKKPTVTADEEDSLPDVDDAIVATLSEEVGSAPTKQEFS